MPLRDCLWESVRYFISRTFFENLEFLANLLSILGDFLFKEDPLCCSDSFLVLAFLKDYSWYKATII